MKKSNKKNHNSTKAKTPSLTVLLVSVFLISTLAGAQFIGEASAAIPYTEYTGTLDGADWALRIPDPWNGMLVVICRGYNASLPSALSQLSGKDFFLNAGFAIAASNFGVAGNCIPEGVDSTYQLTMYIIDTYHVTGKVFLFGLSMGGAVALLLGEKYPDVYSGVLDLFGTKDLKDIYIRLSRWANLTDEELTAELTALTAPIPPYPFSSLQALRTQAASLAQSIELNVGGTPATHLTGYQDRSPLYHANIEIPVITVHGTSDCMVPYYQSTMYQTAVAMAHRSYLYRLYSVTGGQHVESSVLAQVPARFNELVAWSNELTGSSDWPMFGYDPQRSGYSTSNAPNTNQTLWTTKFSNLTFAAGGGSSCNPAVVDGKVYVTAYDDNLYCFDAATGAQIWNYTAGGDMRSSPAVVDGKVYVTSRDNNVYCLNALTGAKIWSYNIGGVPGMGAVVAGGKVFVGADDGKLYCLRADWGQVEWAFTTGAAIDSTPTFADGKVYFGSVDHKVYCVGASTGSLIWSYTTGDEVYSVPAVAGGRVYVCSFDDNVYCLNAATGSFVWSYTTGDNIWYSPTVAYDKVYVTSMDKNLYCLDAATGALIWSFATGNGIYGRPAVADGKVYVGSLDLKFYCLDAATGAFIWSYRASGMITGGLAVANGVAYAVSMDNTVYAFSAWAPIPEGLTIGVMLLLSTVAVIVSLRYFRKRPKWQNW